MLIYTEKGAAQVRIGRGPKHYMMSPYWIDTDNGVWSGPEAARAGQSIRANGIGEMFPNPHTAAHHGE